MVDLKVDPEYWIESHFERDQKDFSAYLKSGSCLAASKYISPTRGLSQMKIDEMGTVTKEFDWTISQGEAFALEKQDSSKLCKAFALGKEIAAKGSRSVNPLGKTERSVSWVVYEGAHAGNHRDFQVTFIYEGTEKKKWLISKIAFPFDFTP